MQIYPARKGFTLLELAIVIVVIGLITAIGIQYGMGMKESARQTQTQNKLDQIEKSLIAFGQKNGRLPCPAEIDLSNSNPNVGIETGNKGNCTNASSGPVIPTALQSSNNVVEGAVPTSALGLPSEFMYDGWDHKIVYAVDASITDSNALNYIFPGEACDVQVEDASHTNRSKGAAYVLYSAGPDGHGGYLASGKRFSSGSVNADELQNCHCDSTANNNITYTGTYIEHDQVGDPTTTNNFDDIVRYKERWQLQYADDKYNFTGYNGPNLLFGISNTISAWPGYVASYVKQCGKFNPQYVFPGPIVPISGWAIGLAFTPGNQSVFIYTDVSPYCNLYIINGNKTMGAAINTFPTAPASTACPASAGDSKIAMSDNGYLAITEDYSATNPYYVQFWKLNGNVFYSVPAPGVASDGSGNAINPFTLSGAPATPLSAHPTIVSFSHNADYLALSDGNSYANIYARGAGDFFEQLPSPSGMPVSAPWPAGMALSQDDKYLAVTVESGGSALLYIWRIDAGNVFTPLSSFSPMTIAGDTNPSAVTFSQDSQYLAFGGGGTGSSDPNIVIFKINPGDVFTQLAAPANLSPVTTNWPTAIAFSNDSSFIALATPASTASTPTILIRDSTMVYRAMTSQEISNFGTLLTPQESVTFSH